MSTLALHYLVLFFMFVVWPLLGGGMYGIVNKKLRLPGDIRVHGAAAIAIGGVASVVGVALGIIATIRAKWLFQVPGWVLWNLGGWST